MGITYAVFVAGYPVKQDYTPPSVAVNAGDVLVAGVACRVAHVDIAVGQLGALSVGGGVYKMPKVTTGGSAIGDGVQVYWDATNHVITATAAGNTFFGNTLGASIDADATQYVFHMAPGAGLVGNNVGGVAAGYKIARGQHPSVAAADTVVTGLTTVVAAFACLDDDLSADPAYVSCTIGDQAGAPAAGSIIIKTWKPTVPGAAGNPTPIASGTFTKKVNWIAIGT